MTPLWPGGEPIDVSSDAAKTPRAFTWRKQEHRVQGIAKRWRVDGEWWHRHIWREYFKLYTDTGLLVIVYRDMLSDRWYLQRVYD
jgi:hypothetical protein